MKQVSRLALVVGIFLACSCKVWANDATNIYAFGKIPEALRKDANAVVRQFDTDFTIEQPDKGSVHFKYALTIVNAQADNMANLHIYYDKTNKVKNIKAIMYDSSGTFIKKLDKDNILDLSAYDHSTLAHDQRFKFIQIKPKSYPYTIVYEYDEVYNGFLNYPNWVPQCVEHVAVEQSIFRVITKNGMTLRYKEINLPSTATIEQRAGETHYIWQINHLPAVKAEPFAPTMEYPSLYTAPDNFRFFGIEGNMRTWDNFATWISKLNAGRDELPEDFKAKLVAMTSQAPNEREKIRIIYDFLQKNTRYVGKQLGLSGWQPFPATDIYKYGYGDCKGLTNYTKAMLKAIGIPSYYTLVRAGKNAPKLIPDFPSSQFNHAFLCVPLQNTTDTVWLECTSQTTPFGYLGNFTGNRDVLIIDGEKGYVVHTPQYSLKDNLQTRKAFINLTAEGNATAKVQTVYAGLRYDNRSILLHITPNDRKKWLQDQLFLANFEVTGIDLTETRQPIPAIQENLQLNLPKYASVSGKRIFIEPSFLQKATISDLGTDLRHNDIELRTAWSDIDTVVYQLPDNYSIETKIEDIKITSRFGEYTSSVKLQDNRVLYIRTMFINKGLYAKDTYTEFVDFYNKVYKADRLKMVIIKSS